MALGLVGKKRGMTRIFSGDGKAVPVTVIEVIDNRVTQIKSMATDGYKAVQITAGYKDGASKPMAGVFAKANTKAGEGLWEFRLGDNDSMPEIGSVIAVDLFQEGQQVDVIGTSKGKGFAGAIKRWNFRMQDATHGNSRSHRAPGSIGQNQSPGRVFKGKKMAGHMGSSRVTTQSLEVVRVDKDRGVLLIKGAVPGAPGNHVIVRPAVKARA